MVKVMSLELEVHGLYRQKGARIGGGHVGKRTLHDKSCCVCRDEQMEYGPNSTIVGYGAAGGRICCSFRPLKCIYPERQRLGLYAKNQ